MEYILTTDKLTKVYGEKRAADAISLHIKKGDVYGLIGRNGAGKTTILPKLGQHNVRGQDRSGAFP